jgi:rhodanese-related sulfurtransferase
MEAGHREDVVFVDNRFQSVFEQSHVEGARLMPTDRVKSSIGTLPLNKWLIMYCT